MYYRDVEYIPDPQRNADIFEVWAHTREQDVLLFHTDGRTVSEKQWVQSPDLDIGQLVGEEAWVSFWFDSDDEIWNIATGIVVDNAEIIGAHWLPWAEFSGEVHLNWSGGLPKYFVYRNTSPDFDTNPPELRSYTPFTHKYENSLNDEQSYYYKVR